MTKGTCREPDCDRQVRARGLCNKHYQRWRMADLRDRECALPDCRRGMHSRQMCKPHYDRWLAGELPYAEQFWKPRIREAERQCAQQPCGLAPVARGMCRTHYGRWKRAEQTSPKPECTYEGCYRPRQAKGYCTFHYYRFQNGLDLAAPRMKIWTDPDRRVCSMPNCSGRLMAKTFCDMHYQRFLKHGDPQVVTKRKRGPSNLCEIMLCDQRCDPDDGLCDRHRVMREAGRPYDQPRVSRRYLTNEGYVQIRLMPDHWMYERKSYWPEHRVVMSEHLGRKLEGSENVHHRDGVRHRNEITNLELWVKMQPCGQRPRDLVERAREILGRYAEMVDRGDIAA
jgi:hypothetical protein